MNEDVLGGLVIPLLAIAVFLAAMVYTFRDLWRKK
jgi:hypothetical protein